MKQPKSTELYDRLGVRYNASQAEIRRAYREKAKEHHPDKTGGNEEEFKKVSEAYDVLKDKEKRARYDRTGDVSNNSHDAVTMCLMEVLEAVIASVDPDTTSVIEMMDKAISEQESAARKLLTMEKQKYQRLVKINMKIVEGGTLKDIIEARIARSKDLEEICGKMLDTMKEARMVLKDCKYKDSGYIQIGSMRIKA